MGNKEEIKRIDRKYYIVRELETDGKPVKIDGEMLQPVKSIDDDDCQHCVLFDTDICGAPCSLYGFMVRVLPENSEEKDEENLSNMEETGENLETEKEETTMERKIGEIFEYNGEWYQCIVGNGCDNCAFNESKCYTVADNGDPIGDCCADRRKDNKDVIFKKLEKVGEPYAHNSAIVQKYRIRTTPVIMPNEPYMYFNAINNTIEIEIKQTKEDMEENELIELLSEKVHNAWMKEKEAQGFSYGKEYDKEKKKHPDMLPYNELKEEVKEYDRATVKAVLQAQKELSADVNKLNLKPFDLEAAKSGKPVCTRDGRKARIVCFDAKGYRPIVALIEVDCEDDCTPEDVFLFTDKGYYNCSSIASDNDLMMLPEKKEGWINVYRHQIHDTLDGAEEGRRGTSDYIQTIKVSWEE